MWRKGKIPFFGFRWNWKSTYANWTNQLEYFSLNPEIINVKILAQHLNVPTLERIRFLLGFFLLIDHVTLEVESWGRSCCVNI